MKGIRKGLGSIAASLTLLFFTSQGALADINLIFDQTVTSGQGGSLSYGGTQGTDPLVGTSIVFGSVLGQSTPSNSGVTLYCYPGPCLLTFSTGPANNENLGGLWLFDGGGTFTLVGGLNTVDGGGGTQVVAGNSNLISGTFDISLAQLVSPATAGALQASLTGFDSKNPDLTAYYGLGSVDWSFANTDITATGCGVGGDRSFSCTINNADITNTVVSTPSPAGLVLLGSGLLAAWAARRRRV